MASYGIFANYYDTLTSNIPYDIRGEYFNVLIEKYKGKGGFLVDLACGTGSLSEVMYDLGYDVMGIDMSCDMLSIAMDKKYDNGKDIMYVCQDMRELELYGSMDICLCALDSINHVIDKNDVQAIFNKVSYYLDEDGLFIFDVNTPYKHQEILKNNTFIYDYDEVYCIWQNNLKKENVIEISLDLFCKNEDNTYSKFEESFSERSYSHNEILTFIENSKLTLVDFFAEDSFEKPKETTQRVVYIAKKHLQE